MNELERGREAIAVIEYAAEIKSNSRRGVWILAWLEDEKWAVDDFKKWRANQPTTD